MKKQLTFLTIATIGTVAGLNLKQASKQYEFAPMTITINHEKYLENMENEIKKSFDILQDHSRSLHLVSWADNYIKTFNAKKIEAGAKVEDIQKIDRIEKFVTMAKDYLNEGEDLILTQKLISFKTRLLPEISEISDAVLAFKEHKEYQTNSKLQYFMRKFDRTYREFGQLIKSVSDKERAKMSLNQTNVYEKIEDLMEHHFKLEIEKFINLFLEGIEKNLEAMRKDIPEDSQLKVENTQKITDLISRYKEIKAAMKFVLAEKLSINISTRVNKINGQITHFESVIQKESELLVEQWEKNLTETKKNLQVRINDIQKPNEFEKIEEMLKTFKEQGKKYLDFKKNIKDLNISLKKTDATFTEIQKIFTEVKFIGINQAIEEGPNTHFWSSEAQWKAWITGSNYNNLTMPVFAGAFGAGGYYHKELLGMVRPKNITPAPNGIDRATIVKNLTEEEIYQRAIQIRSRLGLSLEDDIEIIEGTFPLAINELVDEQMATLAVEGERLVSQGTETAFIESLGQSAKITTKTIYAGIGAAIGVGIGLGFFVIPEFILNSIQTNGAGLTYTYARAGYATAYLAPMIQITKTGKPQAMKYLNTWDMFPN